MLNSTLQNKSALARLLATENLSVQYSSLYSTASFDLKSRTINIPLIPILDEDILDLFEGHEVGHARETPPEGFHSAIQQNGEINEALKTYINIVEDIRIERKIKIEYPGLRRSFANAYKKLVTQNFFGEDLQQQINTFDFIDRLNIEAKVGSYILVNFNQEEKLLLEESYTLETWDEVVEFAKRLMARQGKQNKQKKQKKPSEKPEAEESQNKYIKSEDQQMIPTDEDLQGDPVEPSKTDTVFREKEQDMFDKANREGTSSGSNLPKHITVPKYNINEFVIPSSKISPVIDSIMRKGFNNYCSRKPPEYPEVADILYSSYDKMVTNLQTNHRNDNMAYVNFLIKEFELRKNAKMLNRGKVAKTGKINISQLYKYRISNDIFKRVTNFPEGKNHGMIMYLDLSGSMATTLSGVFNQVLILSDFCRKVNIPFRVYGFADAASSVLFIRTNIDNNFIKNDPSTARPLVYRTQQEFHLKEYISSELNAQEYKIAFNNILVLKAYHELRLKHRGSGLTKEMYTFARQLIQSFELEDIGETLGSTPLNDAIVFSQQISNEFVSKYNVTNMVNIFLTDGDDNRPGTISCYGQKFLGSGSQLSEDGIYRTSKTNNLITHHNGTRYIVKSGEMDPGFSSYHLLKFARKVTGARYIGYYLAESISCINNAIAFDCSADNSIPWNNHKALMRSKFRKDKFILCTSYGYNDYFFISNTDTINLDNENDDEWFDSLNKRYNGNLTTNNLSRAFISNQTKKQLNRILLVHFSKALAEVA